MDSSDDEWIAAVTKSAKILRRKKQTEPRRRSLGDLDKDKIDKKAKTPEPKQKLNFEVDLSSDDEIEFNVPTTFKTPAKKQIEEKEFDEEKNLELPKPKSTSEKKKSNSSDSEVDELEAFFTKMKTPSRSLRPISPEDELEDFIVSDSEDVGGEEISHRATINFNETTILNPDPVYTDDEDNKENFEDSIMEVPTPSDPFSDSSDEFLKNIRESAKKNRKKKEPKLPKFTAGVTPDSIRKIMKTNVRNERLNSPKTPKSKADRLMDKQLNRDFSPRKTPSKVYTTPVKTPTIKKSETTPCGFDQCILYDVDQWSSKRLKDNLAELIEEIYETINRTIFGLKLPVNVKHQGENVFTSKDGLMTIVWNKHLRSTAGRCRSGVDIASAKKKCSVELAPHILDTAPRIRDTLLHELIHAANWIIDEDPLAGHGPKFRAWGFKSLKTHPEIPPVKTTHSYQINYKYWWECENMEKGTCTVKIGRKTNSLKLDRVRCAKCGGNFVYVRFKYHQKEKRLKV